ncbi:MAG: protein kinase [Oscillatoria sp. SIO1A7]|nr:protein kinase [Oscillatoria sp. SIO1A7]
MALEISQCLNPDCLYKNQPQTKFCQRCGSKLLLADRYRAIGLLGQGGFGRTWKAIDLHRLDTPCVIKQFLPLQQGKAAIEKATQLFRQEAMRLRDLGKHSQIPDLLAFVDQEGKLYLVQEFIEGKTLRQEMGQSSRFSEEKVRDILADLLPVLDFIHQHQVIHRDIKPDNIMRSPSGSLVLIDFGVSKQTSASVLSQVGTVTGTPGYAPMEQTRGIVYPSSDLYSLGVTCIRLLTGCLPTEKNGSVADELFDSRKLRWVWREQLQSQGQRISQVLDSVLDKLLQDLPEARYQTAAEVVAELEGQRQTQKRGSPKGSEKTAREEKLLAVAKKLQGNLKEKEKAIAELKKRLRIRELQLRDLQGCFKQKESDLEAEKSRQQDLENRIKAEKSQRQDLEKHIVSLEEEIERLKEEVRALDKQRITDRRIFPGSIESSRGIDYSRLLRLLADGEWKEADTETARLMLAVMGKQGWWQVKNKDVKHFACKDLSTIDRLWSFYSDGGFGLLLQKEIYESLGSSGRSNKYDKKIWEAFGDRVGWRDKGDWLYYENLTFSIEAPKGHLPSTVLYGATIEKPPEPFARLVEAFTVRGLTSVGWPMARLFDRVKDCGF